MVPSLTPYDLPFLPKWGFHMPPIYANGHISATGDPIHFMFGGDGGSNGAIYGSNKSKMAAAAMLEKFQMVISPQTVVRSTSCISWVEFIAYTEDICVAVEVFDRHGVQHHLYADDKQACADTPVSDVPTARATLRINCTANSYCGTGLVTGVPYHQYYNYVLSNVMGREALRLRPKHAMLCYIWFDFDC